MPKPANFDALLTKHENHETTVNNLPVCICLTRYIRVCLHRATLKESNCFETLEEQHVLVL